jgi:hypothetical protein
MRLVTGKSYSPLVRRGFVVGALCLATMIGCGATQFAPQNRHLIEALQTAVTSKNTEWLDAVAKRASEEHDKHVLSDVEFKSLQAVISSAQTGDWKTAESRVFALSEGQRPTRADVARMRDRNAAAK